MGGVANKPIKALVLAAGEGSRLRKYAKQKTLHHVAGVPLLGRVLQSLKEAGVNSVHIVTGYEGEEIRQEIGEYYSGLDVNYVIAPDWEKGNLHSFLAAEGIFKENFILCMGDHLFDSQIVKNLINMNLNGAIVLAVDRTKYSSDDTKVLEHEGVIHEIGKNINPLNCVDTGFFFCSPKIFLYAKMAAKQKASELADCIQLAAQNGDARVFDASGHYWVDVDTKADVERAKRLLGKHSQKKRGASDFIAHYVNRPIENAIIYRISDSGITPNQVTILTNALAYIVTALLLFGHLLTGSILMFIVGVIDGLDGKLARIRGQATRLGRMEHAFDLLFEFSWLLALAIFLSQSQGLFPLTLAALSITFIAFYRFCYDQFSRTAGVSLDVYGQFELAFRRVAGRRNIYNVYILIGVLLGVPLYSLIGILIHSAITAAVYAFRAAVHTHALDKKRSTRNSGQS
ncbi:MAG: NTP transferase domain-containing protein [Candidatus Bathyarchaeota archaeon]|nr:MAG: NTP transferase domain-containing protein [Candidatus Bathyarchaeota archaeon]